jgi:uncharacterized repeat protein (TIGR02543 family)
MKKSFLKNISLLILTAVLLLSGCDDILNPPDKPDYSTSAGDVTVRITTVDNEARTVVPTLTQFSKIELIFKRNDGTETLTPVAVSIETGSASFTLPRGTWDVTANAYSKGAAPAITARATRTLTNANGTVTGDTTFTLTPIGSGGLLQYTITLPGSTALDTASKITIAGEDGTPLASLDIGGFTDGVHLITSVESNKEVTLAPGRYRVEIKLYKSGEADKPPALYREIVVIAAGLITEIQFDVADFPDGALSVSHAVTFDSNGGETGGFPKVIVVILPDATTGTLPTPPTRTGYIFMGWNALADGTGTVFTADTEVEADITVFAKWVVLPIRNAPGLYVGYNAMAEDLSGQAGTGIIARSIDWLREYAVNNGVYEILLDVGETLNPTSLSSPQGTGYVTITLKSLGTAETVVQLGATNGSLFTVGHRVTLILGSTITLKGRNNNNNSLVTVSGTLIMKGSSKITGNTVYYAANSYGGGVYVSNGNFTMEGNAVVSGNTVSSSANPSRSYGGGVYVSSGNFTMEGNAVVSGNTVSSSGYGSGVYVSGNLIMKDSATVPKGNSIFLESTSQVIRIGTNFNPTYAAGQEAVIDLGYESGSVPYGWEGTYTPLKVVSGVTLTTDILKKFQLGEWHQTNSPYGKTTITGRHLYGTQDGETNVNNIGRVVVD